MGNNGYYVAGSCQQGSEYYYRHTSGIAEPSYKVVVFLGYRPNPAEIIIRDGDQAKLAYRVDLFLKRDPPTRPDE
jgi:hypothetical protein